MARTEKIAIDGIAVEEYIDKEFIKKVREKMGEDVTPITIILIKQPSTPIIITHENQNDVKNKIVHITSSNEKFMHSLLELLEKGD